MRRPPRLEHHRAAPGKPLELVPSTLISEVVAVAEAHSNALAVTP
jgi:hypothetical protein